MYRSGGVLRQSSDRTFGLVFATLFFVVAALPLLRDAPWRTWSLIVALVLLGISLFAPRLLAPLNLIWTRFGLLLNRIVSPVVLGVLFYGVVMPTGLLMRLFGKDPLRLKFNPQARSYWIERTPPGPDAASLKNQF